MVAQKQKRPIQIVLPDAGPLISLACGDALDLLLSFKEEVRIVVTDVVEFEATHRWEDYEDARAIKSFFERNSSRIEVLPTTIGSLALSDLRRRQQESKQGGDGPGQGRLSLPADIGELSITSFVISLRTANPGDPMLVIVEDDWFAANTYALPGNVHLVSTSAWLDGLEELGAIESAAAVRARIQAFRPNFREAFLMELEAEKIIEGTDWKSTLRQR
jgi:hypothetical protein